MTAIAQLAKFVAHVAPSAHSEMACRRARLAFLDTIGCAIQGATTETGIRTRMAVGDWGGGSALVIGSTVGAAPPWAALANGAAAHAMDLDDYTLVANDHPSAVLVPAVLAASATRGTHTLGNALDAYLVGLEVIFRIGAAVNMEHYNLGWHTTSTIDGLGAAAAVCRLYGLDAEQVSHALALTVSMNAGMVSQFGTSAKPLHAGLSAKNGVLAATLAQSGLTGNAGALDGAVSFSSLMVPQGQARFDTAFEGLGDHWGIDTFGLGAKVYPSCGYTHRSIDAAIDLHHRLGIAAIEQIDTVHVSLPDFHLAILPYHLPDKMTEALFSTAWCVATALLKGRNTLADFSSEALSDPAVRSLTSRISVTARAPKRPHINVDPADPDCVELTLADGSMHTQTCARWTGMPGSDLDEAAFVEKFRTCLVAAGYGGTEQYASLVERLLDGDDRTAFDLVTQAIRT